MKINKHFTIDPEIDKKLKKEGNASGLINDLLKGYYNKGSNLTKIELENMIRTKQLEKASSLVKNETEINSLQNTLKLKNDYEKQLKEAPKELVQMFISYPGITSSIIAQRSKEFNKYNMPLTQLVNILNIVRAFTGERNKYRKEIEEEEKEDA